MEEKETQGQPEWKKSNKNKEERIS